MNATLACPNYGSATSAELKLAAYNLTNRLNLADPVLTVTDGAFGQAVHQNNTTAGRQLEYSLRIHF